MRERILYLIRIYVLTVAVFIAAKVVFMACHAAAHPSGWGDIADVVRHGLSLDLSTSIYILLLPYLLVAASIWWRRGWPLLRKILKAYYAAVALAMALAFTADTSLYAFWGFKLDASCLQYLATPGEAFASVPAGYILLRVAILVAVASAIYIALATADIKTPPTRRVPLTIGMLLMLVPLFVGIRGGLGESTTNIGQVYFSQNQFLNHAAINPVFSFLASLEKTARDDIDYAYYSEKECGSIMDGLYSTDSAESDTLLNTTRPDIIVILMESCGGPFTYLGGHPEVTPNLTRLAKEGIAFNRCYANSWRTDRGTVCTYSGYPSFPTFSVMKMPGKSRKLPSIARTLQQQGYKTNYLYGGDINFTNMRSYLVSAGFEAIRWKDDYTISEQNSAKWGVRDDITFATLYGQVRNWDSGDRHFTGFSTLSSHEPWDVPLKKFDDKIYNAFYYLDKCIGDFIGKVRCTPQWENLLVIILPDHSINYKDIDETTEDRNLIPMIWVGGAVRQHKAIGSICNQSDLAATLLGQLRLNHDEYTFSRDVLSKNYRPFAVHNFNNGFSVVDSTGYTVYDLNSNRTTAGNSREPGRHVRLGKAILQATAADFKKK